jgi:hypothetical protein
VLQTIYQNIALRPGDSNEFAFALVACSWESSLGYGRISSWPDRNPESILLVLAEDYSIFDVWLQKRNSVRGRSIFSFLLKLHYQTIGLQHSKLSIVLRFSAHIPA